MNLKLILRFSIILPILWVTHSWLIYPPAFLQHILSSILSNPMIHNMKNTLEDIKHIPIENRINIIYLSYKVRQLWYNIALSQDNILKIFNDIEMTEIDYFNTFIFISALYTITKDEKLRKNIDKFVENGYISKKNVHNIQILFITLFSILFRDVENAI